MADFFLDTFTGSGNLSTHVPELGTWTGLFSNTASTLTDMVLDGSGAVSLGNGKGDLELTANCVFPVGVELNLEITLVHSPTGNEGSANSLQFGIFDNNVDKKGCLSRLRYDAVTEPAIGIDSTLYRVGGQSDNSTRVRLMPYQEEVTLTLNFSANRKTLKLYKNGVAISIAVNSIAAPQSGYFYFWLERQNLEPTKLLKVRAYDGPYEIPTDKYYFLYDSFKENTAIPLSSHTSDSGHTWEGLYSGTLGNASLYTADYLELVPYTAGQYVRSSAVQPSGAVIYRIHTLPKSVSTGFGVSLFLYGISGAGNEIELRVYDGSLSTWKVRGIIKQGGVTLFDSDVASSEPSTSLVKVVPQIKISANRLTVEFWVNNTLQLSHTVGTPLVQPANIGFNSIGNSTVQHVWLIEAWGPYSVALPDANNSLSFAHLKAGLSGGTTNTRIEDSLGGLPSLYLVGFQYPNYTAIIPGVTIDSLQEASGVCNLKFDPATYKLSFKNGVDPGYGTELVASVNGNYHLRGMNSGGAQVSVIATSLPTILTTAVFTVGDLNNNLFDRVLKTEALAGVTDYRCFYLKNTHPTSTILALKLFIKSQPTVGTLSFGLDPAGIGNGIVSGIAQLIANETTAPTGVTFVSPSDYLTAVLIGDLPPGNMRAIWLRRTIPASSALNRVPYNFTLAMFATF